MEFDSYEIAKNLHGAGFDDRQAEALLAAMRASRLSSMEHLATKDDLASLETKMERLEARMERLEAKMEHMFALQDERRDNLRVQLEQKIEARVSASENKVIKWLIGLALAQTAIMVAIAQL